MIVGHQAFTLRHDGLSNVIVTPVTITNIYNNTSAVFNAVWDTGAMRTTISQKVVDTIGCIATDKAMMIGVGSKPKEVNIYDINLKLLNNVTIQKISVLSASEIGGCDVLIGMDIITLGDLAITNCDKKTVMTFSIPSHKTLDFVERAEQLNKPLFKKGILKKV